MREICPYFAIIPGQTGLRRTDRSASNTVTVRVFLWKADAQSGFREAQGECKAIRSQGTSHSELTLASTLETEFVNKDAIVAVLRDCWPDQSSAVIFRFAQRRSGAPLRSPLLAKLVNRDRLLNTSAFPRTLVVSSALLTSRDHSIIYR